MGNRLDPQLDLFYDHCSMALKYSKINVVNKLALTGIWSISMSLFDASAVEVEIR